MPVVTTPDGSVLTCDGCDAPIERINHDTMVFDVEPEVRKLFHVPEGAQLAYVVCEPFPGRPSCLEKARVRAAEPVEAGPHCPCKACRDRRKGPTQ
jgi:hypothetical protein